MGKEYTSDDIQLFEDIANGKTFNEGDKLPELYRSKLLNLLYMQGDSESSGALGYLPWIEKAPEYSLTPCM